MDASVLQSDYWYPETERLPIPEGEHHLDEMLYLIQALRAHFREDPAIRADGDLFLFHTQGGPAAHLEPDVFVVKDAPPDDHSLLTLCLHGKPPCMVIEVTSKRTERDDLETKKDLYEKIGIQEYFLHDVLGEYLRPPLQGYQLRKGRYERMEPGENGSLMSWTTSLILKPEPNFLRLIDAATRKPLLSYAEAMAELDRLRSQG